MSYSQMDVCVMAADIAEIDIKDQDRAASFKAGILTMLANDGPSSNLLGANIRLTFGFETLARSMLSSLVELSGIPRDELLRQFRSQMRAWPEECEVMDGTDGPLPGE